MTKFKDLPQKEQEGYVINYTDPIKIKVYILCYHDTKKALEKLKSDDKVSIDAIICRRDMDKSSEEHIKASARDVIPVMETLIKEGRYFRKEYDYRTLDDVVENETRALNLIPEEFLTDALVERAIESQRYPHVRDIPLKYMTAQRFVALCKKDRSAIHYLYKFVNLLSDDELLEVICVNSEGLRSIPVERWNKELLYHYLEYCVKHYKDTGFMDYMVKVPEELKDKVYYQCCCMTGGFYYSKIPEDMKKTVISMKLIAETIRRWDIEMQSGARLHWNGLGWMLQYLPKEFKAKEVCLEVCKRYPYAIKHVPEEFIGDDSFWEELLSNECFIPLLNLEKVQEKHLSKKYLEIKKEVIKDDKVQSGTFNPKTEDDWKLLLSKHGAKIADMPDKFMSVEMLLIAMRSSVCAVEKNKDVINKLSGADKVRFWNKVVEERLFSKPISVPDEYMSKAVICEWIKGRYCYDVNHISKTYRTEDVLIEFAKSHPDRFTFEYDIQTQELIDTVMSLQTKDICKAMYLKRVRPDLRRKELVDELCLTVPREMISLDSITREQINTILSNYPNLIVYAPMWYIRELRSNSEEDEKVEKTFLEAEHISLIDEHTNIPVRKQIEFPDIMVDDWEQISLFDLLGA